MSNLLDALLSWCLLRLQLLRSDSTCDAFCLQAYAAARMAESVLLGMQGTTTTECAYVESDIVPGVDFFAHKVCCHTTGHLGSNSHTLTCTLRGLHASLNVN
jgi:hypothetical protein